MTSRPPDSGSDDRHRPPSARFFEQHWPVCDVTVGDEWSAVAGIRAVGRVESAEGRFVYKVADEWKTTAALDRDLLAFELLPAAAPSRRRRPIHRHPGSRPHP